MYSEKKSIIYRIVASTVPRLMRFIFSCKVVGKENIPKEGAVIIASNHVTALDPVFVGDIASKRQIHYMAKEELFKKKIISSLLRSLGAFPVARGTGAEDALNEAFEVLNNDGVLGVFIEGTRSKDGNLGKPKTGVPLLAFDTKATIVPVNIIGKDGKIPKFGKKTIMLIGEPIPFEQLGMEEKSSMHYRRGAKNIMVKIAELREKSIEMLK